jgi:hypothetical protein
MKLPQSSASSLPSLGNRWGLNIRSQSYPNDLAFSLGERIDLLATVEREGHLSEMATIRSSGMLTMAVTIQTGVPKGALPVPPSSLNFHGFRFPPWISAS